MFEETSRVLDNRQLMPGMYMLKIEAQKSARDAQPGQFAMIKVASNNGCMLRRPISIHRASGNNLYFLYSVTGKGTSILSKQKKGQTLSILAPLGNGFRLPDKRSDLLLIAGGRGIAPLVFLAEKALKKGFKVELLIGARSKECLYQEMELATRTDIHVATEDGSVGYKGKITELFLSRLHGKEGIYACGPVEMYKTMSDLLKEWRNSHDEKIPSIQISLETRMACGLGACYSCTIRTHNRMKKVCSDGPVFNLEDVLLEEVKI